MRWRPETVTAAIVAMLETGEDLGFAVTLRRNPCLVRGAIRRFGSWRGALSAAGVDPGLVYARRSWARSAVLGRIRDLYAAGVDISLASMARADPRVVAAACQNQSLTIPLDWNSKLDTMGFIQG